MSSIKLVPWRYGDPARDPAEGEEPWPPAVVLGLVVAGALTPLICFAGAFLAYALADRDQANILIGAGLAHVLLGLTLFGGV